MLGLNYAAGAVLSAAAAGLVPPAAPSPRLQSSCTPGANVSIEVLATTDVHGHIRGWDYYANRADPARGLARAATIVDSIRGANPGRVVLVDAGDFLQGTPLAFVTARQLKTGQNAIVAAMNTMRYDAVVIGNHEFNYGVPYLDSARTQARFPLLASNVRHDGEAGKYASFVVVKRDGVSVGIVGATTPGSNLWDASNLAAAKLHVADIVPSVRTSVAEARAAGADAIVVVVHSGLNEPSSYDTVNTGVASENVAEQLASAVPGIDVIVYGHSHKENKGSAVGHTLLIQPRNWATSVAVATIPFACSANDSWNALPASGALVQSAGHPEAAAVVQAAEKGHAAALAYVNTSIGTTPDTWSSTAARMRPTPIMNFIMDVERRAANADLASASAFDLRAHLGPGPITVAQIAQLYPYDNTLRAVRISGAQLREYLDFSSRYYKTGPTGRIVIDTTVAGYNFDMVTGVEYTIDLNKPLGQRVTALNYKGRPVAPTDSFKLALNNYRQSGGGGYTMLRGAPVVYDRQQEIRQLLIDDVERKHVLRESDYDTTNWSLIGLQGDPFAQPRPTSK